LRTNITIIIIILFLLSVFFNLPKTGKQEDIKSFIPQTGCDIANSVIPPNNDIAENVNKEKTVTKNGVYKGLQGISYIYHADLKKGKIGSIDGSNDDPVDNVFIIPVNQKINACDRIWLEYDLEGLSGHSCVARSINEFQALGGLLLIKSEKVSRQRELIANYQIHEGNNIIRFSAPEKSDILYHVSNVSLVVDKAEKCLSDNVERCINITVSDEFFSEKAYIKGFLQGKDYRQACITVGDEPVKNVNGEFECVVNKPEELRDDWIVNVRAVFPDGQIFNTPFVVKKGDEGDVVEFLSQPKGLQAYMEFTTYEENLLVYEGASVKVPAGALNKNTEISITALRDIDLPTLSTGMVNVTAGHKGFRFLPHGAVFSSEAEILLPYDKSLIPQGYTENDVRTYYFDEWERSWIQLPLDTVNIEMLTVFSKTTHFTDMINGIIKVPESPETQGYTPTTMKDVKAADPSAGIVAIEAPQANNMGSAGLSFPFKLPAGRAGMQPQLGLQYNSGGGNGWLGLGWDMNIPCIGIDIQWGSPRYDASVETETYTLLGEQLFPLAHRGTPQPRTAEKTFNLRIEGSFNKTVRHGNSPKNYWWEVTDKMGVKSFYGGTPSTGVIENAVLKSDEGNIAHWALVEMRDANNNFVRYDYEIRRHAGISGGSVLGSQLYIRKITYTGHGQTAGVYNVQFIPKAGSRTDTQISGNLGFKQVTAELLEKVEIRYQNEIIRSYKLEYETGAFFKTLLKSVAEYDADGELFYKNSFDYYDDVKASKGYAPYSEMKSFNLPDDNLKGGLAVKIGAFNDDMSLLGGTKSTGFGAGAYAGVGAGSNVASKGLSAGANYNYSRSESHGILALVDINGDGLPDKVFVKDGKMYFRPNTGANNFGNAIQIQGINEFAYSTSNSHNIGASAYFGPFEIGYTRSIGDGKTKTYFSDFNGDGLIDIARNGTVYFNRIINGVPTFSTTSAGTPAPVVGGGSIDPSLLPDTQAEQAEKEAAFPLHDVVRLWEAPLDGTVSINAPVYLVEDKSDEALDYTKKDGVNVQIQHKGATLWRQRIEANDYTVYQPSGVSSINVKQGDRVYFRVQSVFNGAYDLVEWDPEINYIAFSDTKLPLSATDFNGKEYSRYKASEEFVICGEQAIQMPYDGYMKVEAPFKKGFTGDTVWIRIEQTDSAYHNLSIIYSKKYAPHEIINNPISFPNFRAKRGNLLSFIVEAKTNVLWENISWKPIAEYTSADNPKNIVMDGEGKALVNFAVTPEYKGMTRLLRAAKHLDVKIFDKSVKKDSLYALPLDTLRLISGDSVRICPNIFVQSLQMPVKSLTMLVRGANDTVYTPKIINLTQKNEFTVVNKPDFFTFKPKSNDSIWIEFYVNDDLPDDEALQPAYRNFLSRINVRFVINKDTIQSLPATLYGKPDYKYMGAGYRGWGAFGYNGNGERASKPIDENMLKMPDRKVQKEDEIKNPEDIQSGGLLSEDQFIMFSANAGNMSWTGYDLSTYISATQISSSRMGEKDVQIDPYTLTSEGGGMVAVNKENRNSGNNYSAGASAFGVGGSLGKNNGNSSITIDMTDLNGDRFPDLITNSQIQYTGFDANLKNRTGNNFVHESTSDGWGVSANGRGEGSKSVNTSKVMGQKSVDGSKVAERSVSLSGNIGENNDRAEHTYMDINGDGLPDRVYRGGNVSLNLGYSFAPVEQWGFSEIRDGEATSIGGGLGVSLWHGSFQAGVGLSKTDSYSNIQLIDVNGDGLPDILNGGRVSFNTGNGFAESIPWNGNLSHIGDAVSTGQSANTGVTFGFTPFIIPIKIVVSPSASVNVGLSYEKAQLNDMNGDGYPDYVFSEKEDNMKVQYSTIGKTNLMRSVNRPFGGSFTLDYTRKGNTYEQPHSQWVLSKVKSFDGFKGDGVDSTLTTYSYADGYYDRNERGFYGYKQVTTNQHDMGNASQPVYRKMEQVYDNSSYYTKGKILSETMIAATTGDTLSRTVNSYELRDVQTGEVLPDGFKNYDNGAAFIALKQTQKSNYEEKSRITTSERYVYDLLGNITSYFDLAAGNTADRVECRITYHNSDALYLKAIPKSLQVITDEGVMRERETNIDDRGNITQIRQTINKDGAKAVYDMAYDEYGNISRITRPANYRGQRMFFEYTYDPVLHSLPIKVTDAFGYESGSSYEYRFGMLTQTTDMNKNNIRYAIDNRGRITTITAPNEMTEGKHYTIKFEYITDVEHPYAITRHAMPDGNEIITYTFVDGMMRPLQVKKTAAIFNGEGKDDKVAMIVSGWNIYDGFGRTIETYQSIVEDLGNETKINTDRNPITPTRTVYDTKDRALKVTLPDGAESKTKYLIGNIGNENGFITEQTDPLGRVTKAYTDAKGRQRAATQMLDGEDVITRSEYNALGEALQVINTKGEITYYMYDLLGRKLSVNHPDAGLTEFEYDAANNLLKRITPNIRAMGDDMFVEYKYDYNRLNEVIYPKNVQNYVQYTYGEPGAKYNRAGRLVLVQDASGGQELFYDALGNVSKEIRSILVSSSDLRTYISENKYDSWGRQLSMTYPDGEVVNYVYNAAGNLRSMSSEKDGYHYEIIKQLGYNEDEQKIFKLLGNGTQTTYTYEQERKRLATMVAGTEDSHLFNNKYEYDAVDNILSVENNNATIPIIGLGGKTSNFYQYDDWNRLINASGTAETKSGEGNYTLEMKYDKLYNITRKNQFSSLEESKTHDREYKYEDANHPNAPSQIGSMKYQYDANGNPVVVEDTAGNKYRRMIWDEENRLMLLSDNGNGNSYVYDYTGERVIKCQTGMQNVYIDGMPAGMLQNNKNFTVYVGPNMVVRNDGFTKHYYAGTERVLSKLGTGEFNNKFTATNKVITAGNQNYIQRQAQLQKGIEAHYRELQIPPGNPTQKATLGQPENTGQAIPTVVGNYEVPRGWPKAPTFAPPGGPPGPPIQFGETITNDNVKAGYGYKANSFPENDQYYYHPDHLGSTSIITNKEGIATQFVAYLPFGESFVDEHSSRKEMPYKFNAKELDCETGLYYYVARYYDPMMGMFLTPDLLAEKYYSVSTYAYVGNNPVRLIDPNGMDWFDSVVGVGIGIVTNIFPGTNLRSEYTPTDAIDYNRALQMTDAATMAAGGVMMVGGADAIAVGSGIAAVGGGISATGVGVPIGGSVAVVGGTTVASGTASVAAGSYLMVNAANNQTKGYNYGENKGIQVNSKTLWTEKNGKGRIDVENPAPGKRPGQVHYQDGKGGKYVYNSKEGKFMGRNSKTGQYTESAPNSVNKQLENEDFKKAIDKGLKYLGE